MKLVVLDRDGVINHDSAAYIKSPDEWRPIEGSLEAIARLRKAGYRVAVATNQAGVGRGLFDMATLAAIHSRMTQAVTAAGGQIDGIFFCPHAPQAACGCRKPQPGMLLEILRRFGVEPGAVAVVGDSLRDLQAAQAAGCQPALVLTGNGVRTREEGGLPEGTTVHDSLADFAAERTA
ncbi:MAG: D-glycero-beta-D-manno-heptose 1,7-bisphosphate 7-phosphatase [Burkholderiales bacterium]|nr:D-glycero-beta-D-manno-heptose 1,7-bisphosphate 7-phosphatase [Burkholderiales bacterium]